MYPIIASMRGLDLYFREIDRTPLLTAAEEVELAQRAEAGDAAARDQLIRANLRLVVMLAKSFQGNTESLTLEDLISEGNFGLLRATESFDWRRGLRFSTYATHWVRQSLHRAVDQADRLIRVPRHAKEGAQYRQTVKRKLRRELGREPTATEWADAVSAAPAPVPACVTILDSETPESGSDLCVVEAAANAEERERLEALLAQLPPREREIIRLRFGLGESECMTLATIAEKVGLTRTRIAQLEAAALAWLREQAD
jgi:RNA polymerase primary sigma factor